MKILTFDVEEWFHLITRDSWATSETEWSRFPPRIRENTDRLLDLLLARGVRATFFCLGWVAEKHPEVVKKIHAAGFEIGSHSYGHRLVYEQSREAFERDLERSVKSLEDLTGRKVRAYRAPGFSITRENPWAFAAMKENGIEIDCSVFPTRREYRGFPDFGSAQPALIEYGGGFIKEFPINTCNIAGVRIVFSGGGYFRLLPYPIIRRMMAKAPYVMAYFHPRDFDPGQPVIPGLRWHRRFKSYSGLGSSLEKLERLLQDFSFVDVESANAAVDWSAQPIIRL